MYAKLFVSLLILIANDTFIVGADPDFGLFACTARDFLTSPGIITLDWPTTFVMNSTQIQTSVPFTDGASICIFGQTVELEEVVVVIEFKQTGFIYPYKQIMTCLDDEIGKIPEKVCQCPGGSGSVLGDISQCQDENTCFRGTKFGNATGCMFMNGNAKHHFKVEFDTSKTIDVINFDNDLSFPVGQINVHVYNGVNQNFTTFTMSTELEDVEFVNNNIFNFTGSYPTTPFAGVGVNVENIFVESIPLGSSFVKEGNYYHVPSTKMNDLDTFSFDKMCAIRKVNSTWHTNKPEFHARVSNAVYAKRCKPNSDLVLEESVLVSKQYANENYLMNRICSGTEWMSSSLFCGYESAEDIPVVINLPPGFYYDVVSKPVFSVTSSELTYHTDDDFMSAKICVHNAGSKGVARVSIIDSFSLQHELGTLVVEKSATTCGSFPSAPMTGGVSVCVTDLSNKVCSNAEVKTLTPAIDESFSEQEDFSSDDKHYGVKESWAYVDGDKKKWTWRLIVLVTGLCLAGLIGCLVILGLIWKSNCCRRAMKMWEKSQKVKKIEQDRKLKEYEEFIKQNPIEDEVLDDEIIDMDEMAKKPKNRRI